MNIFSMMPGQNLHGWIITDILTLVRKPSTADLLKPFGLKDKGIPNADLTRFIFYACDYAFINLNFYQKNKAALSAIEKAAMLKAYSALIAIKSKVIKGTTIESHVVTESELSALSDHLKQLTAKDLNLDKQDEVTFNMPATALNPFLLAGRAADDIMADFRGQLEKARKRLNKDSYIDIRGCRAGSDSDDLRAVQEFFASSPSSKPIVTAPLWYQAFAGTNSYFHPVDRTAIHDLLHKGTSAAAIRSGFATWATMCHADPEHKQIWTDAADGSAVKFVLLDWRKKLPQLPVDAPGLTTYLSMNFIDFVNKSEDFFNIPKTAIPKGNFLTDIDNYVTSKLRNYAKDLLAQVDGATDQTKLNNILAALKLINTELGNPVNPFPAPPIGFNDLIDLQNKLITSISDNQLKEIKPFMATLKSRITDPTDPGLNYYMLFGGMPVYVFSNHETINNHVVKVYNNMLVILDSFADSAYRTWMQLSWAEPLPAGNRLPTMHPGDFTSRRSMMMVQLPTGGNTPVAVCPNSDYFNHITSV